MATWEERLGEIVGELRQINPRLTSLSEKVDYNSEQVTKLETKFEDFGRRIDRSDDRLVHGDGAIAEFRMWKGVHEKEHEGVNKRFKEIEKEYDSSLNRRWRIFEIFLAAILAALLSGVVTLAVTTWRSDKNAQQNQNPDR